MGAFVEAQVDPLAGERDSGEERRDEVLRLPREGEDGTVVVRVGVDVEQPRVRGQRVTERVDDLVVASLREVGDGFQQHANTLRGVKAYYSARAREDDA